MGGRLRTLRHAEQSLILTAVLAAAAAIPLWAGTVETIRWPVSVRDPSGAPVSGLSVADFQVRENGAPVPLLRVEESKPAQGLEPRFFVIYLGEDLDFRELFRARRALTSWAGALPGPDDRIAVYRQGGLSRFSAAGREIRQLINFFRSTGDRYDLDPPEPEGQRPVWFRGLPVGLDESTLLRQRTEEVLRLGTPGSLESALGRLKHLEGRKALVYLGRDLPFSSNPSARQAEWLIRSFSDSGVSVFLPLKTGETEDEATSELRRLANATGGSVIVSSSLREALGQITTDAQHYYRLEVQASGIRDARYRKTEVRLSRPGLQVRQPDGYFATVPEAADLAGRTFLTALGAADDFGDLPLEITAQVVVEVLPRQLELRLSFPFAGLQPERSNQAEELQFFQTVRVFAGVFSRQGALLAFLDRGYTIHLEAEKVPQAAPTQLAFDGTLPLHPGSEPHRVLVIVIAGQNLQIAVREVELG